MGIPGVIVRAGRSKACTARARQPSIFCRLTHEHVREGAKAGLVPLEVEGKDMPASLVTNEGRVGVLLGLESRTLPRQFPTPFGNVRLVTVKALLPAELEYVSKRGAEGAAELAQRFAENGEEHVARANRRAVV